MASKSSDLHRIVVVGGGAGGLELVTRLGDKLGRRKLADVTLIDKYRAYLWKPLLHEVAAGSMDLRSTVASARFISPRTSILHDAEHPSELVLPIMPANARQ